MNACVVILVVGFLVRIVLFLFLGHFCFVLCCVCGCLKHPPLSSFRSRAILYTYLCIYFRCISLSFFFLITSFLVVCDVWLLQNPYAVFRVVCRASRSSASAPRSLLAGLAARVLRPRSRLCPFGWLPERFGKCCWGDSGLRMRRKIWLASRTIVTSSIADELVDKWLSLITLCYVESQNFSGISVVWVGALFGAADDSRQRFFCCAFIFTVFLGFVFFSCFFLFFCCFFFEEL